MADKKLFMVVEPSPVSEFDEWCYEVKKIEGDLFPTEPILSDLRHSIDMEFVKNGDSLEGVKLSIEFKMMDPDDILNID